jgi:hypothetical protein
MRVLVILGLVLVAAPGSSRAALDASSPVVCAIVDVFDCSGEKCVEVDSQTVGVPDLVRVDAAAKTIGALDPELEGSHSKLESVGVEEGKLVARALAGDRSMVLAVDQATGDAILTVSDLKLTLVGYGECGKD